jgi:putative transcriptional regulator
MYWKNKPDISSTLELARKSKKLTQAELALSAGVTRQTILAIEKGNYIPSVALALKLAKILQTNVEQLFTLEEDIC